MYEDPSAGRTSDKPTTSGHQGLRAWVGQVGPVCPSRPAASSVGRRSVCPSALLGGPCTPPPPGSLEGDGLLSGAVGTAAWDNSVLSSYVVVVHDPTSISYQVYEATHELHHNATNNPYVGKQQNLITMSTRVTPQQLHMRLPLNL